MADEFATREAAESPARAPAALPPDWSDTLSQARGGTLHLDEVSGLPTELQIHLLRAPAGPRLRGHRRRPCRGPDGVRYVMSTGESLPALVEQGRFRQELYHRINVVSLMLPPLRHRGTDIELLAESFRARHAREFRKADHGVHPRSGWTSCSDTTGRATSASSRRPSGRPSPCAPAPGSPRANWPPSSTITAWRAPAPARRCPAST